jgi:hypothetical protein
MLPEVMGGGEGGGRASSLTAIFVLSTIEPAQAISQRLATGASA